MTFNGYTPKNKKLYHYPYAYIGFSIPNGSQKIYRYEDLNDGFRDGEYDATKKSKFIFISEINPNPTAYMLPFNYKNSKDYQNNPDYNTTEGIAFGGYPTISYITDYYNAWLAQNSGILEVQMRQEQYNYETNVLVAQTKNTMGAIQNSIGAIGNSVGQMATGNVGGGIASSVTGGMQVGTDLFINDLLIQQQHQNHGEYINMIMAQKEKQAMLPNQSSVGSSNSTLLGYEYFNKGCYVDYRIKREFAEKIDNYFTTYGYAVNKMKIPQFTSRPYWNYIKTVGINILGNIPSLDLKRLKDMFDNGVTMWHYANYFLDYSKNNNQ